MKNDDNGNIVTRNPKGEFERPPWMDVNGMNVILDRLREANKDKQMWDKLSGASLAEKGFNDFYHKDSK